MASGPAGGGESTDPTPGPIGGENCQEYFVRADNVTPDFLIVLDKSGSMGGQDSAACAAAAPIDCNDPANALICAFLPGGGIGGVGTDRWTPSADALKGITANLENSIRFGLMTFPSDGDVCAAGDILVQPGLQTANAIATELDAICPNGATPTAASLDAALASFEAIQNAPDTVPAPQFVLLVTDGEPNCSDGPGGGGGSDAAAEQASYEAITNLANAGVKTYVIGYDTQNEADLSRVLDEMAVRGNTGDTAHRPVEDQASLEAEFEAIAGAAISCTYLLEETPPDPSYVQVLVDGNQVNLDDPNGWTLGDDGLTVQLQGTACSSLQDGQEHTLQVEVKCAVVVPV